MQPANRREKLSISLPRTSVHFVEQFRKAYSVKSRSEVIDIALQALGSENSSTPTPRRLLKKVASVRSIAPMRMGSTMIKRGEIWFRAAGVIAVVPLSSKVDKVYPFEVLLPARRTSR